MADSFAANVSRTGTDDLEQQRCYWEIFTVAPAELGAVLAQANFRRSAIQGCRLQPLAAILHRTSPMSIDLICNKPDHSKMRYGFERWGGQGACLRNEQNRIWRATPPQMPAGGPPTALICIGTASTHVLIPNSRGRL